MPVYCKPGMRAAVSLKIDEHENPKPVFYVKALTKAETIELGDAMDALYEDVDDMTDILNRTYGLLAKYIDGWKHMPKDFDLEKLTYSEVRELLGRILHGQSLTFEEKKD